MNKGGLWCNVIVIISKWILNDEYKLESCKWIKTFLSVYAKRFLNFFKWYGLFLVLEEEKDLM